MRPLNEVSRLMYQHTLALVQRGLHAGAVYLHTQHRRADAEEDGERKQDGR